MSEVLITRAINIGLWPAEFGFIQPPRRSERVMDMEHVEIVSPNFVDRSFHEKIQNIGTSAAEADYGDDIVRELGRKIRYFRPAGERVVEFEYRAGHLLDGAKGIRICIVPLHR